MPDPVSILRSEIEKSGPISFHHFMELALYCPKTGYYERSAEPVGRRGDFVTSVSMGPLFGQLLATQFALWSEEFSGPVQWVEAGAHDGRLACDILGALRERHAGLLERITYVLIEPSDTRRGWQRSMLAPFTARTRWVTSLSELGTAAISGVIFSNELLDSFPIHRLGWDAAAQRWYEWGVCLERNQFAWCRLGTDAKDWDQVLAGAGFDLPPELHAVLPDGHVIEVCPAAERWWTEAAGVLDRGRLVTIDYGLLARQIIAPERREGTLRAYHRQSVSGDILAMPGEQDLTAHVNFTQLMRAGESAGLKTELYAPQSEFLVGASRHLWSEVAPPGPSEIRQFRALTHPEHLGRSFHVLAQSRLP